MNTLISVENKEARVSTSNIWRILGYTEHRSLKRVIWSNKSSFENYGEIVSSTPIDKKKGGQEKSYLLNFEQFIVLIGLVKNDKVTSPIKIKVIDELIFSIKNSSLFSIMELLKSIDVEELEQDKFVYVAKESVSGRYKIGISVDPENRIKQLNTGNPEQLILVHAFLATEQKHQSEVLAHSLFNENRLKGEWFSSVDLNLLPSYIEPHYDDRACYCPECTPYNNALDCVDDNMTAYQAIESIMKTMKISYKEAKKHVDAMIDMGFING